METVKIGKKGQVTIPRRVLEEAGLPAESQVIVESEADGSIRLRPAAVYPIELYSDDRIAEFERENQLPDSLRERAGSVRKRRAKKK
ncbi:MAG: AbrB/MazE/SpoVT family DNA-binding domain-containing protein [Wenzhouxiangellaceae bacterium]